jgi:fructosamine-3-kinase
MKNLIKYSACILFSLLRACGTPCIDEHYAAMAVKDTLSLPGTVTAQKLTGGGNPQAQLFVATSDSKKYVVRIIKSKPPEDREEEIYNLRVAADGGYGPQIYYVDPSQGIVIMEYLPNKKISDQEAVEYFLGKATSNNTLQSNQLYVALANLLRKIHGGKAFRGQGDNVFVTIHKELQIYKPKYSNYVPLATIERNATVIFQALEQHLITTIPCHNDLHGGNLIFWGNEFKAIDYEAAHQGDPYFDIAKVIIEAGCKPVHEKVLFTTYLGRQPSAIENAKLYLMKLAVRLEGFLGDLGRLSPEIVHQFASIKTVARKVLAAEFLKGTFDAHKPENKLKLLKALLSEALASCESQEFKAAVKTLNKQAARAKA